MNTNFDQLLDEMALHARSANFAGLGALVPRIEAALAVVGQNSGPDALYRWQRKAEENARLLDAAGRGLRAARRRLDESRKAMRSLQTYDNKGVKSDVMPDGLTAGRF